MTTDAPTNSGLPRGERDDEAPRVEVTPAAVERLKMLIATTPGPPVAGIRLQIARRTGEGFEHQLMMVDEGAEPEDDDALEVDGLTLYVEDRNADYLDGVRVDYRYKGEGVNGFEFTNPNPVWFDEVAMRVQSLLDEQINPAIAAHGGYVELIDVDPAAGTAFIELGGGCQGCGMADVTLKQGIEVTIREAIPDIERVLDATDHAAGTNPYFQPSKK